MKPVISIKLRKIKMVFLVFGSLLLTLSCFWIYTIVDPAYPIVFWLVRVIAIIGIVFFGLSVVYGVGKLFQKRPAMVIDDEGIHDYSSAIAVNLIRWKEIREVKVITIQQTSLLLIFVDDPRVIFYREPNIFKKFLQWVNYKMFNTPVAIAGNSLNYSFPFVIKEVVTRLKEYHNIA